MKINSTLEGKNVRIIDIDGEVFTGFVSDYISPEDNEPEGTASIILDNISNRSYLIEFKENEIKSIEII